MNVEQDKRGPEVLRRCSRARRPPGAGISRATSSRASTAARSPGVNSEVATSRIKGPEGTSVRSTCSRRGEDRDRTCKVSASASRSRWRAATWSRRHGQKIGVVRAASFSAAPTAACASEVDKLLKQGAKASCSTCAATAAACCPRPCSCRASSSRTARSSRARAPPPGADTGRRGRRDRREDPRGHARGPRQRQRVRDRDGRAARPQAREGRGHAHVRQGPRAGDPAALERRRARHHRGQLLPARRRDDLHEGHQAAGPGRGRPGHRSATRRCRWRSTRCFARADERRRRGRPGRRLDPDGRVLEKRGRFLVAEPLFGPGRGPRWKRGGAAAGDLVLVGAGKRGARVLRRLGRPIAPATWSRG